MRRTVKILSIALIYCGTVFGAGFASGQEIFRFFSAYKMSGIVGAFFVGFLFSFFGGLVCAKAKQFSIPDVATYFEFLFPSAIAKLLSFLCSAFLVVTFCIMIAGCGTLFQEQFMVRPIIGAVASLMLCFVVIKNQVKGLAGLNAIITPFMFLGVTALCVCILKGNHVLASVPMENIGKASVSAVLYLSYNMVSAVAVLVPTASLARTKKDAALGGILGGILVAVPLVLMAVCLVLFPEVNIYPLPFFTLVRNAYSVMTPVCALILFGAMLTTAASAGVSVLVKVPQKYSAAYALILCGLALFASLIPFETLIQTMYTAFGISGLILMVGMVKSFLRK